MKDFRNKVAVVTGGGSGIGLGIARALAGEGAQVVIADLDEGAAKRAADELRGTGPERASGGPVYVTIFTGGEENRP